MRTTVIVPLQLIAAAAATAVVANTAANGFGLRENDNMGLVANGRVYDPDQYPYVVCVDIYSSKTGHSICTGTLITQQFVLTAAHCVKGKTERQIKIYRLVKSSKKRSSRSIKRIYLHPKYMGRTGHADLTMLKLNSPFSNVGRFSVLSGSPSEFKNDRALNCTVIGFGMTAETGLSGIKGYVTNVLVKFGPEACELSYTTLISETWEEYLCSKPDPRMVCPGDSGGPMICNGYQYGIASHAYNYKVIDDSLDVVCGSPDVQTRHLFVYVFKNWIAKTVEDASDPLVYDVAPRIGPAYHAILTASVCAVYARDVTSRIHAAARGLCFFIIIRIIAEIISKCVRL